ncbi:MATE family efflux transporter [Paraferrimonas sedimenticola]|uniref:Multidrug-efflux transporter n=1 Tax=Paraferrimonas sedimenticola TaxID=375674 RepID=A0AA37RVZ2_9GAMM|nr:MATE family efflux transporter [Paraferrimonas sedimenticola]GLP96143.1 putative multidrug resistance protein NorM [Paraferrimonas sedimenticola]
MSQTKHHLSAIVKLAIPIFIAQLTQTMMGFIDTLMAGRVGALDMAAVAIGSSLWLPAILFLSGFLLALTPLVANAHGENQTDKIAPIFVQTCYLALACAMVVFGILGFAPALLDWMDLETELTQMAGDYVYWIAFGAPAFTVYQVLRNTSEGISYTFPTMVIGFIGLMVNIPANYILIYGHFGLPAMGGAGCGMATAIVYWAMCISMILYVHFHPRLKSLQLFSQWRTPDFGFMLRMLKLGFPVAMALFMEVFLFATVALLIAPLGTIVVAGHQVANNFSALVFMLPLSLGIAASIRVGYFVGANRYDLARFNAKLAIGLGLALASLTCVLTLVFRFKIAELYTSDPQVLALATSLMLLAAVYQLSDAGQVICGGALRGYKDMNAIFVITFVSFMLVGLSSGYILGLTDWIVEPMGAHGFWVGFITGLTTASILLGLRLRWLQAKLASEFTA